MNDWLEYKGSGSGRANLNTLEHAAPVLNGGKINAIRDSAKEAAEKIRGAKYDSINKELDALYAQAQAQVAMTKKLSADFISFINAARKFKATAVIYETKLRLLQDKGFDIQEEIYVMGDNVLKTALNNKYNSIEDKFMSAIDDIGLTRLPSDISAEVLNTLIDNINNNSKTNRR